MRKFLPAIIGLAPAAFASPAEAEPVELTVDRTTVRLDADQPVLGCTVIRTSGDAITDDEACVRAREQTGAPPPSMSFQPDARRRFVSCAPLGGIAPTAEFSARCSAELQRIRRMRAMTPLRPSNWLSPRDLPSLPVQSGQAVVRIGIDSEGRPSYCLLVRPRDTPALEQSLCAIMLRRARFRAALDMQGQPMPSVYQHPLAWHAR